MKHDTADITRIADQVIDAVYGAPFIPGEPVVKRSGYPFPGVVAVCYRTRHTGQWRVVVECTAAGVEGCQHIFSPDQIRRVDE